VSTVAGFYADDHWGTGFGVKDALHRSHSGRDIHDMRIRTPIPSLCRGRVVTRGADPDNFGYFVTVRAYDGDTSKLRPERFSYCHLDSLDGVPAVGEVVEFGGYIGPLGTSGYSTGPHLHLMVSTTSNDPRSYAGLIDPDPYIIAARLAPAADGVEPFPAPEPEEDDMAGVTIHVVPLNPEKTAYKRYRTSELTCFEISLGQANAEARGGARVVEVSASDLKLIARGASGAWQRIVNLTASATLTALKEAGAVGAASVTPEQVQAAAQAAIRNVLGSLDEGDDA
jgi:hypothetical protein